MQNKRIYKLKIQIIRLIIQAIIAVEVSQSSLLKKYESLDGRLHQTYYDLDKLNFDDMQVVHSGGADSFSRNCNMKINSHLAELRSDSEGSSSESSELNSRPRSVLLKKKTQTNSIV
ncbi:hypothetical protein DOY81_008991 [Sarcophaga bullata]|nr:hypothetical protein DOY81_008991 [Sarcophaga bullata]